MALSRKAQRAAFFFGVRPRRLTESTRVANDASYMVTLSVCDASEQRVSFTVVRRSWPCRFDGSNRLLAGLALACVVTACRPSVDGGPAVASGGGGHGGAATTWCAATTTSTAGVGGGGAQPTPIFELDVVPIFQSTCGSLVDDCHSRRVYAADVAAGCRGKVSYEDVPLGAIYYGGPKAGQSNGCPDRSLLERLLEIDVSQCTDPIAYVTPCDADASYIFRKINGGPLCVSGGKLTGKMPPGTPLTTAEFDTIVNWITAGAPSLTREATPCAP